MPSQKKTVQFTSEHIDALKALFAHILTEEQTAKPPKKKKKLDYTDQVKENFKKRYPLS